MLRILGVLAIGVVLTAACAVAEEEDTTMGIYEGAFASGPWAGKPVVVQVVALGKDLYSARFPFGGGAPRVGIVGKRKDATTALAGTVNLGASMGGEYEVTAEIASGAIMGRFSAKGKTSAFEAKKVEKKSPSLGAKPPEGATVLFDGTNEDEWQRVPLKWNLVEGGAMEVCGSNLATIKEFGDLRMHLEFRTPLMPNAREQGRGNSGVYIQGRYEIQVLDSFGDEPADNLCGGVYKVAKPIADACLPPLQWQTYDVTFSAPQFDASGKKTKDAVVTVLQNGIPIHQDLVLKDVTPGGVSDKEAAAGPIMLQDHGNAVRYRNIWVVTKKN